MPKIVVHDNKKTTALEFENGASLLHILHENSYSINTPCGGNETCGKCKVKVKNIGTLNSCNYYPDQDIEVIMPDKKESQILIQQSDNTRRLPLQLS